MFTLLCFMAVPSNRMYYHFRPDYYYWILVILSRKLLIAITALMFNKNPAFQMSFALLVLFVCYALQVRNTPYMSMSEREEVLREHRRLALEGHKVHSLLAATIADVKRAGRRIGAVASMDQQKERLDNAAVSFFWNYNTVESVLLFCAVLVNLAGVMFESGRFDSGLYDDQQRFLTWIVVLIIVISVVYFVVVLVSEVYLMINAASLRKNKKKSTGKDKAVEGVKRTNSLSGSKDGTMKGARSPRRSNSMFSASPPSLSLTPSSMVPDSNKDGAVVMNPMFRLQAQAAAELDDNIEAATGDSEQDRISTFATLLSRGLPPTSKAQWTIIQETVAEMRSREQEILTLLAAAKKSAIMTSPSSRNLLGPRSSPTSSPSLTPSGTMPMVENPLMNALARRSRSESVTEGMTGGIAALGPRRSRGESIESPPPTSGPSPGPPIDGSRTSPTLGPTSTSVTTAMMAGGLRFRAGVVKAAASSKGAASSADGTTDDGGTDVAVDLPPLPGRLNSATLVAAASLKGSVRTGAGALRRASVSVPRKEFGQSVVETAKTGQLRSPKAAPALPGSPPATD